MVLQFLVGQMQYTLWRAYCEDCIWLTCIRLVYPTAGPCMVMVLQVLVRQCAVHMPSDMVVQFTQTNRKKKHKIDIRKTQYPTASPSALASEPAHQTLSPSWPPLLAHMIWPLPKRALLWPDIGPSIRCPRAFRLEMVLMEMPSSMATAPSWLVWPDWLGTMQNRGASSASCGFIPYSSMLRRT